MKKILYLLVVRQGERNKYSWATSSIVDVDEEMMMAKTTVLNVVMIAPVIRSMLVLVPQQDWHEEILIGIDGTIKFNLKLIHRGTCFPIESSIHWTWLLVSPSLPGSHPASYFYRTATTLMTRHILSASTYDDFQVVGTLGYFLASNPRSSYTVSSPTCGGRR